MALFGKKKDDDKDNAQAPGSESAVGAKNGSGKESKEARPVFSPEKAMRFFEHARNAHEVLNYEWAMHNWLSGLRHSPTNMAAIEGFFRSAGLFLETPEGKKGLGKDIQKAFGSTKTDLDKFLSSLLQWAVKPLDPFLAVRAAEAASKAELHEPTYWLGERALNAIARDKKPRKDLYVRMMEIFGRVGAFDKAVQAGEAAVKLDPGDGPLAHSVRNLSAQATMSRGGYDQSGQAGGFRANVRDADKQRQLEEAERIVKTEETVDRLVRQAEADYRAKPDDLPATTIYAKRLMERGTPEDETRALQVLKRAYDSSRQFRFRQMAGEIRLRQARRKLNEYKAEAEASPGDVLKQQTYQEKRKRFTMIEVDELRAQMEAYPTDLAVKYELGKRYFELGQHEDAIALFQQSQNEAKSRVSSMNMLGQCFLAIGWADEAIQTYRRVLEVYKTQADETGMELRYWLLAALQEKAAKDRSLAAAEEADQIASSIAIQSFGYRDIRSRRETLKKMIQDLKQGGAITS